MTIHAGTDAGSVIIFDPEALPDDFDAIAQKDPIELISRLDQQGRLRWVDTQSDGSYRLGVVTGSEFPTHLATYVNKQEVIEALPVPSGRLFFTGIEYAFRSDDAALKKHPHMGGFVSVSPGTHKATFCELEYPDGFEESLLAEKLTPGELASKRWFDRLVPLGCFGAVLLILGFFVMNRAFWMTWMLPPILVVITAAVVLSKTRRFRSAEATSNELMDQYPDYLILLQS